MKLKVILVLTAVMVVTLMAPPSQAIPVGVTASAYTGRYYDARFEATRRCIVHRESRGQYQVVNRSSGAAGAYQFLPRTSRTVARWMGNPELAWTRANYWSKYHQDKAFWRLWNHGRGRSHWYSASNPCW